MCLSRLKYAVLSTLLFAGCNGSKPTDQRSLTVVSYGGGAYQESHRKSFIEPFSEITGVPVHSAVWNAEYGKLKAMVESGRVDWDVVEVTAAQFARGSRDNLFQKLSVKPHDGEFLPNSVMDTGVANVYWGTVAAYRKADFMGDHPTSWKDFWDTHRFPGGRALYDDPRGNLEFALLADGVPAAKLYPLDIERAFRKLDQLKPSVRVWWTDGTQPVQLLLTNSVTMSSAWSGRIFANPQAMADLGYSWEGGALELDYWVIPRGSRNTDAASRFILFASLPYTMATQAELIGYGPVNLTALTFISDKTKPHLPTYAPNRTLSFVVDARWWSAHEEEIKARWIGWKSR